MVILLILLISFHYMDAILVSVLAFLNLNVYLKFTLLNEDYFPQVLCI